MKVKALKPHRNAHGEKFIKAKGDEYEHPSPEGDIACKIVEPAIDGADAEEKTKAKPPIRKKRDAELDAA